MTVKLSELVAKAKRDPYELDLEDSGAVISIAQPSIARWQEAAQERTVAEFLTALGVTAEDAARVAALVPDWDLGTEGQLVASVRRHFGLGN